MSMHWAGRYGGESSVNAIVNSAKTLFPGNLRLSRLMLKCKTQR